MSFMKCLYTLFLMPLQILFEFVYKTAFRFIGHPGLSIIMLSLAINLLVLPLYMRVDAIQEEERNIEARLKKGVSHIRKTFRGDERTMMLQTYYRQNHYSPVYALRGALSLLLEIPFFIAAYRFLSHLTLLEGAKLGPIMDLSAPDGLIPLFGLTINLLPILMTVFNVISTVIFTKGHPLKTKIQLYAMAAFFLVFLYRSPSGLVFYWTLNNLFSLIKTAFYKMRHPKRVIFVIIEILGVFCLAAGILFLLREGIGHKVLLLFGVFFLSVLLFVCVCLKKKDKIRFRKITAEPDRRIFVLCAVFLAVLTGLLIPSAVVHASPQEFISFKHFVHPVWYVVSSFLLATGTFVFWFGVFYRIASKSVKVVIESVMLCLSGIMLVDYLFFGKHLGILNPDLKFKTADALYYGKPLLLINLLVLCAVVALLLITRKKWSKIASYLPLVLLLSVGIMSAVNVFGIFRSISEVDLERMKDSDHEPNITLSETGHNVVVIMLDRAMGEYVPYIFAERPELKEQFSGFTYYDNTISFGLSTNFGTPGLFGGYEYTPVEMNRRTDMLLGEKHDEALKVMPVLFLNEGYRVTVCDPTYAGYGWIPDLSIYDAYPEINTFITSGYFAGVESSEHQIQKRYRNFFCYSLMKTAPLFLQRDLYDDGAFNEPVQLEMSQTIEDLQHASGLSSSFLDAYNVLRNLPFMTHLSDEDENTFFMMTNDTTHEPCLLQLPDYTPSMTVDNSAFSGKNNGVHDYVHDGRVLHLETEEQVIHYQTNVATMLTLGKWFDTLKEMGVYDNTRIILVADHGNGLRQIDDLIVTEDMGELKDKEWFFPLLMVKDFNSAEFRTSDTFMTNADVPTLAVSGLIKNPVNPFTGNPIDDHEKTAHDQWIIYSYDWNTLTNNGPTFTPSSWYSIHDSIWKSENWALIGEDTVLP